MSEQKINDGGPAFPTEKFQNPISTNTILRGGMSLRDYFAAKAMAGLCANPGGPFQANGMSGWSMTNCSPDDVAGLCYTMADAMIEARKGGANE